MDNRNLSREYTEEEVRTKFLRALRELIDYWLQQRDENEEYERMEGLVFSILALLDGDTLEFPRMILAPHPHPDDHAFHVTQGENYFAENHTAQVRCDISGALHEHWFQTRKGTR